MTSSNPSYLTIAAALAVAVAMTACGGGGGGGDAGGNPGTDQEQSGGNTGAVYPVTSVPDPVYGADPYAAEKVATFNTLNDDRHRCGFGKLRQSAKLDTAAQGHADYLKTSPQSHFQTAGRPGFTGVSPGDRASAAGYSYLQAYEVIAGQGFGAWYSSDPTLAQEPAALRLLRGLYTAPYHLAELMAPGVDVGIGVSKVAVNPSIDSNTKFLVINPAVPAGTAHQNITSLKTFPCEGTAGLETAFTHETPDPFPDFPSASRSVAPYGQPVYLKGAPGTTTTMSAGVIQPVGGAAVPTRWLTRGNDPHGLLQPNEVFLMPTERLVPNTDYLVTLSGTNTGEVTTQNPTGSFTRSFTFRTGER